MPKPAIRPNLGPPAADLADSADG